MELALPLTMLAVTGLSAPVGDTHGPRNCAEPPGVCRYQPKLDKGMLLVASRDLADPNFSETVVLLVAYGPHGTMGVIINRPSDVKLATVLPSIKALRGRADLVYLGGPVMTNHVLMLIRSTKVLDDSLAVFDDVYASSSLTVLKHELAHHGAKNHFRAFAGHAGWAPGQLEAEIAHGDWYVTPADADGVLTSKPQELWSKLLGRVEGDWVRRNRGTVRRRAAA
jgi:putative transcriptional regulator